MEIANIEELKKFFNECPEYTSGPEVIAKCETNFNDGNFTVVDLKSIFSDFEERAYFWCWLNKMRGINENNKE